MSTLQLDKNFYFEYMGFYSNAWALKDDRFLTALVSLSILEYAIPCA